MTIDKDASNRISWIQFACAIVVVFDHTFDYINYGQATKNVLESVIYFLTMLLVTGLVYSAMAIFFFVSAFLLYKDFDENNVKAWYIGKLKSRFKSLVIPYLLWNAIWTILFLFVGILDKGNNTNITNNPTIYDFLNGVFFAAYNEVFWYVKALIIYVIISPLIGIIAKKYKGLIIVIGFFLSVIPGIFRGPLSFYNNCFNNFFWALGTYAAMTPREKNIQKPNRTIQFIIFIISLSIITFIRISNIRQTADFISSIFINIGLSILVLIVAMCFYSLVTDYLVNKKVRWYTKSSFMIYALHKPFEQAFNKVVAKLFSPTLLAHLINVFGGVTFTFIVVLTAVKVMNYVCPKLLLILNGQRKIFD